SGSVGVPTGHWGALTVYPLDFTPHKAGQFTISVKGSIALTDARFSVAEPRELYAGALENALFFYQSQRDGAQLITNELRTEPAHLNDRTARAYRTPRFDANDNITAPLAATGATLDVEGGWWDAGDYLKFVETHSYTVGILLTGIRDFPAQLGHGSERSDFTSEARFGVQWLLKMWDDTHRVLYYQVGIGSGFSNLPFLSDHDVWRLPEVDDTLHGSDPRYQYLRERPVFEAAPAGAKISPNLAGRLAASFALCARVYRHEDPKLARRCLLAAEHIFDLADTEPSTLLTAAPTSFYSETEWRDYIEWGSTELYMALADEEVPRPRGLPRTHASFYLQRAAEWAYAYIKGANDADILNLYDVSGLAHYELIRALRRADVPQGLAVTVPDLVADLRKQLGTALIQASSDPFRFGFTWSRYDTTTHGAGLAITAAELHDLTGETRWDDASRGWLGNIMGTNAWGLSLIVGDGAVFPHCLQHQVANLRGSLNGQGILLRGAVVEGPNAINSLVTSGLDGMDPCPSDGTDRYAPFNGNGAAFRDAVVNYPNTEPAIDLTASSPLMFAWRIAGHPDREDLGF
ncbi:MAG: glycoside hydrolase family 9 protein, partial [Pseudomonadota bacterium]|nr:glycoside hydrolase family 9 protein [Pseudomonadota bacterium]